MKSCWVRLSEEEATPGNGRIGLAFERTLEFEKSKTPAAGERVSTRGAPELEYPPAAADDL